MKGVWLVVMFLICGVVQGQVKIVIGDLVLSESGHAQPFCAQIPIFLLDDERDNRAYISINFAIGLSGNTEIIQGGAAANMLVAGGFTALAGGVRNPGLDLNNLGNTPATPACSIIHNQATEGYASVDFVVGALPGTSWFLNNNGSSQGYKTGFIINFDLNPIGYSAQGEAQLIAVLEIPIVANPGAKTLIISALDNTTLPDGNTYQWQEDGSFFNDHFDLTAGVGVLRFCPQTLISHPEDVVACPGDDVSFSVAASGTGPFAYQWYQGNDLLPGETSDVLELHAIGAAELGAYSCEISSACVVLRSPEGYLSLAEASAAIMPRGLSLGLDPPELSAVVDCALAPLTYQWRDEQGQSLGTGAVLVLSPAPSASGPIQLEVDDSAGSHLSDQVWILVNPLGLDNNGDGFNTMSDLTMVLPLWLGSGYDADGSGTTQVLDYLYINTGQ